MAIETNCAECGARLRVPDEHAGKLARCPKCQAVTSVPGAADDALSDNWCLRDVDGGQYGPVSKAELDQWYQQGRIDPGSRIRSDSNSWRPAHEVYPSLAKQATESQRPYHETASTSTDSPDHSTATRAAIRIRSRPPFQRPHRGGTIVGLGVAGLICCYPLAIGAVVMGLTDLGQMRAGKMDPGGRGLTQVGLVLGVVALGVTLMRFLAHVVD